MSVQITGFKINTAGLRDVLSSDETHAAVNSVASRICDSACQMAAGNSYYRFHGGVMYAPYRWNEGKGSNVAIANVSTATKVGRWDSATNHSLLKAMR